MSLPTLAVRLRRASRAPFVLMLATIGLILFSSPARADGAALQVEPTTDLAPGGTSVKVTGTGYQPNVGLFVVNCDPSIPKGGACDMANFQQAQTSADGSFEVTLKAVAVFGQTDCTKTPCGIQTSKVGGGADRSQERTVPVGFAGGVAPVDGWKDVGSATADPGATEADPTADKTPAATDTDKDPAATTKDDSGSSTPLVIGAVAAVLVIGAAGLVLARRRRQPSDIQ